MTRIPRWTGFTGKTFWDWLELLVIPLALAAVAFGLNYFANERDQRREDRRAAQERAIATDGGREDALRVYLQQVTSLMLDRDLLTSARGSQVRTVARGFTLTALRRLDARRKGLVVRFLAQAGLVGFLPDWDYAEFRRAGFSGWPEPKVDLNDADLRDVELRGVQLFGVNFKSADLRGADFRDAYLVATDFDNANLRGADFRGTRTSMRPWMSWHPTSFSGACLTDARFADAVLVGVNLGAYGWNVDFSRADVRRADFYWGNITRSNFGGTKTEAAHFPDDWTPNGQPSRSQDASLRCDSWRPRRLF